MGIQVNFFNYLLKNDPNINNQPTKNEIAIKTIKTIFLAATFFFGESINGLTSHFFALLTQKSDKTTTAALPVISGTQPKEETIESTVPQSGESNATQEPVYTEVVLQQEGSKETQEPVHTEVVVGVLDTATPQVKNIGQATIKTPQNEAIKVDI